MRTLTHARHFHFHPLIHNKLTGKGQWRGLVIFYHPWDFYESIHTLVAPSHHSLNIRDLLHSQIHTVYCKSPVLYTLHPTPFFVVFVSYLWNMSNLAFLNMLPCLYSPPYSNIDCPNTCCISTDGVNIWVHLPPVLRKWEHPNSDRNLYDMS